MEKKKLPYIEIEPDPVIDAYKKGVDVTLFERVLRMSPEDRIRTLTQWNRSIGELRRTKRAAQK